MDALALLNEKMPPFAKLMGVEITSAAKEKVVARLTVRDDLCTIPAVLHGGASRALASGSLGAEER